MLFTLSNAIHNLQVIAFLDSQLNRRFGEPHIMGVARHSGKTQVQIYQTAGYSGGTNPELPKWKRFNIDEISGVIPTGSTFAPRPHLWLQEDYWRSIIARAE